MGTNEKYRKPRCKAPRFIILLPYLPRRKYSGSEYSVVLHQTYVTKGSLLRNLFADG